MKKLFIIVLPFFLSLFLSSCSSIPSWFEEVPQDAEHLYAARTATSADMQLALEKAAMEARAEIARQVNSKIVELQKRFIQETGEPGKGELNKHFAIATKLVVNTTLNGSKITAKKFVKDKKNWRAYVLVSYPWGKARDEFLKNVRKDQLLYTNVKNTKLFQELANEAK